MSRRGLLKSAIGVGIAATGAAALGNTAAYAAGRPSGIVPIDKPVLYQPFRARDAHGLKISQGWSIEATEARIIGDGNHAAIDYEGLTYGVPILAAADGWAYACYQRLLVLSDWTDPFTGRKGGYIDEGAGLFVEIQHDATLFGIPGQVTDPYLVTQYVHLSEVAPGIPSVGYESVAGITVPASPSRAEQVIPNYSPTGLFQPQAYFRDPGVAKRVKRGEVIGWYGDTGIGFGWYDEPVLRGRHLGVKPRKRAATPPWDPQGAYKLVPQHKCGQLHFAAYWGRGADGKQGKVNGFDPFDLYGSSDLGLLPDHGYRNDYMSGGKPAYERGGAQNFIFGAKTAFVTRSGKPVFAG